MHRTQRRLGLPEENLLYFLEKNAPKLDDWQRELLRIVRLLAQYFYPQRQTKMMNEGCATFVHYEILNRLYERGQLTDGTMLEFLHSHSSVVFQPALQRPPLQRHQPLRAGLRHDERHQAHLPEPTAEDREWFPEIAGSRRCHGRCAGLGGLSRRELRPAVPVAQADARLPPVRRQRQLRDAVLEVTAIHDEPGYRDLRRALSRHYDVAAQDPDLQITDADLSGSRRLVVTHRVRNGVLLDKEAERTLQYLAQLWGYRVKLVEIDVDRARCSRSTKRCRCRSDMLAA